MFAFGGASSSFQVLAAFNVASSSWIAFSHSGQSGRHFASVSKWGSSALASVVLAGHEHMLKTIKGFKQCR